MNKMIKPKHEDKTENIWQVKAGDGKRDYSDVFLQFGVMLIGPGTESSDYRKNKHKYKNHRPLRQFADEASENDLVVLNVPWGTKWAAKAVGKIRSAYSFEPVFSEVEYFELQHCRRIEWKELTRVTPIRGLGRGGSFFSHVNNEEARKEVERLWEEGKLNEPDKIPLDPEEISSDELIDSLTAKGLPREKAKHIAVETQRLKDLANWYYHNDDYDVGEHEARTFLVVPLIKSLGWDEKHVKIEWEHKDVVLFDKPYSPRSKPLILIESKRLWDALGDDPEQQAKKYTESNRTCDRLVITDGIRYKLFTKPTRFGKWVFSHYLNLLAPKRVHPYKPEVGGAVSFLLKMRPGAAI